MNIAELHNLTSIEKLKIIEMLWEDLIADEINFPDLSWHEKILKATEEEFQAGKIEVLDWKKAKNELRSQLE